MQDKKRCKHAQKGTNLNNEVANDSKVESGSAAPMPQAGLSHIPSLALASVIITIHILEGVMQLVSNSCNICHMLYGIQ